MNFNPFFLLLLLMSNSVFASDKITCSGFIDMKLKQLGYTNDTFDNPKTLNKKPYTLFGEKGYLLYNKNGFELFVSETKSQSGIYIKSENNRSLDFEGNHVSEMVLSTSDCKIGSYAQADSDFRDPKCVSLERCADSFGTPAISIDDSFCRDINKKVGETWMQSGCDIQKYRDAWRQKYKSDDHYRHFFDDVTNKDNLKAMERLVHAKDLCQRHEGHWALPKKAKPYNKDESPKGNETIKAN
jgi:hypothetical protein